MPCSVHRQGCDSPASLFNSLFRPLGYLDKLETGLLRISALINAPNAHRPTLPRLSLPRSTTSVCDYAHHPSLGYLLAQEDLRA
jgi:hypothetical protein